jgi:uncharacterized membrane protein
MTNVNLGSLVIFVGCCIVLSGFRKVFRIKKLKKYGLRIEGQIIKIEEIEDEGISYRATIKALMPNGVWLEREVSSNYKTDYSIGQKVDFFVDKNNQKHFFLQVDESYSSPVLVIFFGICLILFGIHVMLQTQEILN